MTKRSSRSVYAELGAEQVIRARRRGLIHDDDWKRDGHLARLEDNLCLGEPLPYCVRREFEEGDGNELFPDGDGGNMYAVYSSSALCCNLFLYWRRRHLYAEIAKACGLDPDGISCMRFEMKMPVTGVPPGKTPPNLDFFIAYDDGRAVGFECKFREPYAGVNLDQPPRAKKRLSKTYVRLPVWKGLANTKTLALELEGQNDECHFIERDQLVTRVLGLNSARGLASFEVVYLWYDVGGRFGGTLQAELDAFADRVRGDEYSFRSVTYQEILKSLKTSCSPEHGEYIEWMQRRYFPEEINV